MSAAPIDEHAFEQLADATLSRMESTLGDADDRLEVSLSQGVLTIAFEDKTRFIVNSHRAARQIWMAAGAQAWHFDWDGSEWRSTKTQEELWTLVGSLTGAKLGTKLQLS